MTYVIVDLDGTCADCSARLTHIVDENGDKLDKPNWKKFYENCIDDLVFEDMKSIVSMLYENNFKIYYVTGRPDSMLNETVEWINTKFHEQSRSYKISMRDSGDFRQDHVVKAELFDDIIKRNKYKLPWAAFEDRDHIINIQRENYSFPIIDVKELRS